MSLGNTDTLKDVTTGLVQKVLDTSRFARKYSSRIEQLAFVQKRSANEIAEDLHNELASSGAQHHSISVKNIYTRNDVGAKNAKIWATSKSMSEAKAQLRQVLKLLIIHCDTI